MKHISMLLAAVLLLVGSVGPLFAAGNADEAKALVEKRQPLRRQTAKIRP